MIFAKIIQYGCRDAPCEKSWKQGNPLAILSRILAQSCVTLCLNYVGRVTHDCARSIFVNDFCTCTCTCIYFQGHEYRVPRIYMYIHVHELTNIESDGGAAGLSDSHTVLSPHCELVVEPSLRQRNRVLPLTG